MRPEEKLANLLIKKKKSLSTAESCTGGLIAHRLTNIPGSSAFFKAGLITYAYESKTKYLKVPSPILKKHGAVSHPVIEIMAKNVRKLNKTDYGIATSGIAGPTGATKTKPIGLVFIGISSKKQTIIKECRFKGSRTSIKSQAATTAMKMLIELVLSDKW